MELLAHSTHDKKPNPEEDEILAVFFSFSSSSPPRFLFIHSDMHNNDKTPIHDAFIFSSVFALPSTIDQTALHTLLPPFLQHSFHAAHFVHSECDLITATINALLSFNPDIIVAVETQRDSIGYFIDRCEHLHIPATLLLSRCPFSLLIHDTHRSSLLHTHFFVDPESNEYRYDGRGDHPVWEMETGVANVNEANTTYNQSKGNALSVQGRYGVRRLVVLSVVLSLFRVLRRNGFHGDNNTDFSAIMLNLYGMTVPRFANHVLLSM